METFIDTLQQVWYGIQHGQLPELGGWNYMLMALFMMFQGRASAVIGGIAAATGYLNLGLIILVALAARVVVDLFWYRVGASRYVDRVGRRIGPYEQIAARAQEGIRHRPFRFVLLSKIFGGLSMPLVMAVGNAHVPFRRWLPASFAGELLWTLPLLLLGYFATDAMSEIEGSLTYLTLGLTGVFVLFFLLKSGRTRLAAARRK